MVSIIENRSLIKGRLKSVTHQADEQGFYQLVIELLVASDMEGYPNLATADEGKDIVLKVAWDSLKSKDLHPGCNVEFTVRKAFGQMYYLQS